MFCSKCGAQIPDDAQSCPQCQESVQKANPPQPAASAQAKPVEIKSGLVQAILVTVFCCLPFGIVAIVYGARVSGLVAAGDISGAQEAARKSNMWSWLSFAIGLLSYAAYIFFSFLAAPR
ncbi:MAG: Interferon-induced transmembrane protein [Lentisphaerae bacterium ADurb.Bin242]|nr:MAG: Interferon-induced transmembrane protein [Lentisphaerae bacterium ADurb.Bin242]